MLFDVRTIDCPPWAVVTVVGDVDLATLPALSTHLSGANTKAVALDISGVDHFDPICFGVVIAAALKAKRRSGRFCVVCPAGRPRDLLAETGLDQIINVLADRADLG
ncbi:MAG TPA: STAS domain-containing protein [Microthrixaceae bacterium]|nr:STAS domain-containing protein [Microthrixaceae bacterium]